MTIASDGLAEGQPRTAAWRTSNLGYLLFAASDHCVRDKLDVLRHCGFGELTDAQMALFHHIARSGDRLTTIAARARLTKQSMIELVDRAVLFGFVDRQPDPVDRRAKIVVLTARGGVLLDCLRDAVGKAESRFAECTGTEFLADIKRELGAYVGLSALREDRLADRADTDSAWRVDNIGRVLAFAARRFVEDVLRAVHEQGNLAITDLMLPLVRNLAIEGTRLTEIASKARMTKQSMGELVDRAERLGLVRRQTDPLDGRAKLISFTADGLLMLEEMRRGVMLAEERFATERGMAFLALLKSHLRTYLASPLPVTNSRT